MFTIIDKILLIFLSIFGLTIGSFLNVCIARIPEKKFFYSTRSRCPKCGHLIKAYDNIPVISYIFLRGKCRYCKEKISPQYPIVELLNPLLWVGCYLVYGLNYITIIYCLICSILIVMSFIDLNTKEIPNGIHIWIICLALIAFAPIDNIIWYDKLIGAICISLPLLIIALITGGIGGGDVKLFFVLGLLLGWKNILVTAIISILLGGLVGVIILIIKKKAGRKIEMPFGPFIAIGTVITLFWGSTIINFYLSLMGI